jgi:hypothetical protein
LTIKRVDVGIFEEGTHQRDPERRMNHQPVLTMSNHIEKIPDVAFEPIHLFCAIFRWSFCNTVEDPGTGDR